VFPRPALGPIYLRVDSGEFSPEEKYLGLTIDPEQQGRKRPCRADPVIGGESVHKLGYLYAIFPAGAGAVIMLLVALLVNNIPKTRRYPEFWF